MKKRNKLVTGFTLVELLTVIAIIGILAAILIPSVSAVRNIAKNSKSQSNLRQIGIGVTLAAKDKEGLVPHQGNGKPDDMTRVRGVRPWYNSVEDYISSANMVDLNDADNLPKLDSDSVFVDPFAALPGDSDESPWLCYAPSYQMSDPTKGYTVNMFEVEFPTKTVLFSETANYSEPDFETKYINADPSKLANDSRQETRISIVFFDGHIEQFNRQEISEQANANKANIINTPVIWNPFAPGLPPVATQ